MNNNKKKKIGCVIIMHPGQNNYGSSLQGFATIYKINEFGYDYEIIRYNKQRSLKEICKNIPDLLKIGVLEQIVYRVNKKIDFLLYKKYKKTRNIRRKAVDAFKTQYLDSKSHYYTGFQELQKGSLNYSAIMVGSDQVWGPFSLYSKFYNLLFVDDSIPKFSYASSFGVSEIAPCQKKETTLFLNRFDKIGLREQRGKEIVQELTNKEAQVVLDPTFLLTRKEWEVNINESKCQIEGPYILCYILGERKDIRESIRNLRKESGIKIVNLPHIDNYHSIDDDLGDINLYDVDPFDFIKLIRDASYIVTDSFHGSVFSIIFHKKFITFYRKNPKRKGSTHSRIDSLFSIFNIKNRIYNDNIYAEIQKEIDYNFVDTKLDDMRTSSILFFKECLSLSNKKCYK